MRIGTRITVITVTLALLTLGLFGWLSIRARRAELMRDLERQTALVGSSMQVALESLLQKGDSKVEDLTRMVAGWQAAEPSSRITFIDLVHSQPGRSQLGFVVHNGAGDAVYAPPPADPTRRSRLARLDVEEQPVGQHVSADGKEMYTLTVPIRDPEHKPVAAIEITRDEGEVETALASSARTALYSVLGLGVMLGLLVALTGRSLITKPLGRLLEAIDDVTQGDLGRVILRERDDEVGDLADRFNEMTGSLRDARAQILQGVDAKLALEARLRHSEKLATIGQLAAGIAHEVGTPLNVIGGRARQMERKADDPDAVAKNAGIIATQTQRITKIIQQLLDFARRPSATRTRVDLQGVAKGCIDFLEHQLSSSRVEPKLHPFSADGADAPGAPIVLGDADQLQQVCLNLFVNAIQAMPDGGTLELSTRTQVRRRPGLETAEPGGFVVLEVADTGVGIPEEDRERIFEPFYSTKRGGDQGGTGLGLSVSVGIVKDHDGWIEIDSRPGGGTIFRVYVPAVEVQSAAA